MKAEAKVDPTGTPPVPPKVLAGLIAGEVGAEESAPAPPAKPSAPQPRTEAEIRASLFARLAKLEREDLLVAEWVLSRLPFAFLVELCQRATREGVEPLGKTITMPATSAVQAAQQGLLSAIDKIRPLVGLPPRKREGTGMYLRPAEHAALEAEKASGR